MAGAPRPICLRRRLDGAAGNVAAGETEEVAGIHPIARLPGAAITGVVVLGVELEVQVRTLPAGVVSVRANGAHLGTPPGDSHSYWSRWVDVRVSRRAHPRAACVEADGYGVAAVRRSTRRTGRSHTVDDRLHRQRTVLRRGVHGGGGAGRCTQVDSPVTVRAINSCGIEPGPHACKTRGLSAMALSEPRRVSVHKWRADAARQTKPSGPHTRVR
jgi:hypothetical protein